MLFVARIEHRLEKLHEARGPAHVFRRTAAGAVHECRVFRVPGAVADLFHDHVVAPVVAEIVDVEEAVHAPLDDGLQTHPRRLVDLAVVEGVLTPLVEPLSIDEAFMDLSGTRSLHRASPAATLAALARRVERELSIAVSIGLSYNKFLAKIASDLDKPRGFAVIGRAEARAFLAGKPVGLLWGVGDVLRNRLASDGIARIGQLVRLDEAELVARYGKIGRRLFQCARGEDDRPVDPDREAKSMSSEITLGEDLSDAATLRPILWQLAETVARRMKKAGVAGGGVTLKLKTADFHILTRARRLNTPTRSAEEMFRAAEPLLAREADGRAFRLIGIGAHDLVEARSVAQSDLFGGGAREDDRIDEAVDTLRDRFGEDAIVRGRGFGTRLVRQGPSKDN